MKPKQDMISARQLAALTVFSLLSIIATTAPQSAAVFAGPSGWLAPLFGILPVFGVVCLIQYMYKKRPNEPFDQIFYSVFGPVVGRFVLGLYALWCIILCFFSLRVFGERVVSSMFVQAGVSLLSVMLLGLCLWAIRGRLNALSRLTAICTGLVTVVLLFISLAALPDYDLNNLYPINPMEAPSIVGSGLTVLGTFGIIVYSQFLSSRVSDRQQTARRSMLPLLALMLSAMWLIVFTIGILGSSLATHMQNPFLIAVKNITGIEGSSRFESVIIALWTMPTFVFITLMSMVSLSLISSIVKLESTNYMAAPIVLLIYVGAASLARYAPDVLRIYRTYLQYGHYLFQYGFPLLLLGVGKLRKKF